MAKRKATRRAKPAKPARKKPTSKRPSARAKARPSRPKKTKKAAAPRKKAAVKSKKPVARSRKPAKRAASTRPSRAERTVELVPPGKVARLDRARRTLDDIVPTPPSSLDLDRSASAVRSGRAELAQQRRQRGNMSSVTGGDVDVNVDNAYFSGDEAPGGDNPTPDMNTVDDIGKALGDEYNDNEELKSGEKLTERDKHRWELDPASSEDYKDRD